MDYKEKLELARKLLADANAIYSNKEATAEDRAKAATMVKEATVLKSEITQLKELEQAALDLQQLGEQEGKGAPQTKRGKFGSWNEWLVSAWRASDPRNGPVDPRLNLWQKKWDVSDSDPGHERKDLAEGVGATGGFLVPVEFDAQLRAIQAEQSVVRKYKPTVIRMARRQVNIPVLDQTSTTAGVPHWFGGLTFYWEEENTEKTESDPSFRQISLVAHKLIGYTRASDELVDDSAISLGDFLSGPLGFAGGVAWMEDWAFLRGTGAGQPLGVINAGATITVAAATAAGLTAADLVNMYEAFLPSENGVWIMNHGMISNLLTIQGPDNAYLFIDNARDKPTWTIFGLPVVFTEKLPAIGTTGCAVLADWRYYMIGDRQATTIESTKFDRWRYDQTSWRVVHRVDGQPWLSAPLTLQDGTLQVSPFVMLGAKST